MRNSDELVQFVDDKLDHANLLVERSQDVFSSDGGNIRENYARGYVQIYLLVEAAIVGEKKHRFPFMITQNEVTVRWAHNGGSTFREGAERTHAKRCSLFELGDSFYQGCPMLNGICDFIDSPEEVIPSRAWPLGFDEFPLLGRELLCYSTFPKHPPIWEDIRFPCISVYPPKWKPDSGRSMPVSFDDLEDCSVKGRPKAFNDAHGVPTHIFRKVCSQARDYVSSCAVIASFDSVRLVRNKTVDDRFQFLKLAFTTSDMLT